MGVRKIIRKRKGLRTERGTRNLVGTRINRFGIKRGKEEAKIQEVTSYTGEGK